VEFSAGEIKCEISFPATQLENCRTVGHNSIHEVAACRSEKYLLENLVVPNLRILWVGLDITPMASLLFQ
jgi:hypothetical protein